MTFLSYIHVGNGSDCKNNRQRLSESPLGSQTFNLFFHAAAKPNLFIGFLTISCRFSLNSYSLARHFVNFSFKVPDYRTIMLFQRPNTCFYK